MRYLLLSLLILCTAPCFAQIKVPSASEDPAGIDPGIAPAPDDTAQVYTYVDEMPAPRFDLTRYLSANIMYPPEAKRKNIQGRVMVRFIINKDGSISDVSTIRGIGGGCDEEAVRLLKAMPNWKPAIKDGKKVRASYTQPIIFKLSY